MLKTFFGGLIFSLLMAINGWTVAGEFSDLRLRVSPVHLPGNEWKLDIQLEYYGKEQVTIYRSNLPWGIRYSLLLVPIVLDPIKTRLEESQYIDDPGPEQLILNPGDKLSGTVKLLNRFPDLGKVAQERDVIIFWSYQFRSIEGQVFQRLSGAVIIPKQPTKEN